jgi:glycerol kinase
LDFQISEVVANHLTLDMINEFTDFDFMILGVDQGTTGTTAVILNDKGRLIAKATVPVQQFFPKPGWVEHDPEQVWKTVGRAVSSAIKQSGKSARKIRCIGLTNQRETVSLFRGRKALHRFIVWQDRRTADSCASLKKYESTIAHRSGLPVDPYFSATKIKWIQDKLSLSAIDKDIRFRTIDSFLMERMTGADVIEVTNASRTSLLSLRELSWGGDLFDIFGVPRDWAPRIIPSQFDDLKTKGLSFLPDGIPVCAALGDQQAALFGQSGWNEGDGKITFGTGSFILLNTGSIPIASKNKLISTVALQWKSGQALYALEGSAFICGAWVQWLRDQLRLFKKSSDVEALAKRAKTSGGVFVLPALSGWGAPFWSPESRGAILGLTRGSGPEQVARASLEALAFQNRALVDAMKGDAHAHRLSWKVDGGAVSNNLLMQIQSNALGLPLQRPKNLEATATGVALLAAHQKEILDLETIQKSWKLDREFKPNAEQAEIDSRYRSWISLAKKSCG